MLVLPLVACGVRPPEPPPRAAVAVGLDGWLLAQPAGKPGSFSARVPESLEGIDDLPHLLAALGASPTPTAWRWPDRVFPDVEDDEGFPDVPPPVRQGQLDEVRLTILGLQRDDSGLALAFRGPEELYDPVVTRLRDEHLALVGARQRVYRAFALSCAEVDLAPLPLDPKAGTVRGQATCTRLPIDDGWLVSTEYPVGVDGSCMVWAAIAADGTASPPSTACRDDLLGDVSDPYREHHREHLVEMAYSTGAGPSSPEGWFRPKKGGELLVLLNRFRGVYEDRCLAHLPPPGEPWRPEACVSGPSLGP